jgi:hypothetical protein
MHLFRTTYVFMALLIVFALSACGSPTAPTSDVAANSPAPTAEDTDDASPNVTETPSDAYLPDVRDEESTPEPIATPEPTATPEPPTPTPEPEGSRVTGENSFARGAIEHRPWMVMIDNHPDAYPQSGLGQASILFEGLAEGGSTRYMALFQDGITPDLAQIGPVRSARIYFVQWAMGYHPLYVHVGGSPDGQELAQTTDQLINLELDDFIPNPDQQYGWREASRFAPHNLYTSSELLRRAAEDKDVADFDDPKAGYLFDRIGPAESPAATSITYYFNQSYYISWSYDPQTNSYYRTRWGSPHIDPLTGEQIRMRNVVVMEVDEDVRPGDEKGRIDLQVVGSGRAVIFMAGRRIDGTWRKDAAEAPLRFYDNNDAEMVFNLGQISVAAIPSLDNLSVQ